MWLKNFFKYIQDIQTYVISISLFFAVILFVPFFSDAHLLPKLTIIRLASFSVLLLESIRVLRIKRYHFLYSDLFLLIFLAGQVVSWVLSANHLVSFFGIATQEGLDLLSIVCYVSLTFVYTRQSDQQKTYIKLFLVAGTLLSAVFSIYKYFLTGNRPYGLEGQPVLTASVIALGILIFLK